MQSYAFRHWMFWLGCLLLSSCQLFSPTRLSDETIHPSNAGELELLAEYPLHYVSQSFAFSPNSNLIAINDGYTVSIINLATLTPISTIYPPFGPRFTSPEQDEEQITAIAFLSNETLVTGSSYSAYQRSQLGSLRLWSIRTRQEIAVLDENAAIRNLTASADGRFVAYIRASRELVVMNMEERTVVYQNSSISRYGGSPTFSPNNIKFAMLGQGLFIFNLETQEEVLVNLNEFITDPVGLVFSPNSEYLAIWGESKIDVFDSSNLELVSHLSFNHGGFITVIAFAEENRLIAGGSGDTIDIQVYDYISGQSLFSLDTHGDMVFSVASHPNYPLIITGSGEGLVKVWNLDSESDIPLFQTSLDWAVYHLAFCPNGNCLIASSDRGLQIWGRPVD